MLIARFSKELLYMRQVGPKGKEGCNKVICSKSVACQGQKLNPGPSSLMSHQFKSFSSTLLYGLFLSLPLSHNSNHLIFNVDRKCYWPCSSAISLHVIMKTKQNNQETDFQIWWLEKTITNVIPIYFMWYEMVYWVILVVWEQLDAMILEVFSKISDSVILCCLANKWLCSRLWQFPLCSFVLRLYRI